MTAAIIDQVIDRGFVDVAAELDEQQQRDAAIDRLLAGVRAGDWLDAQQFPPIRWAVPDLIPEGLTILIGPPKAGKSWLILNILLGLAAGGRTLGKIRVPEQRRVLYLALEDGDRRMQDRCRLLLDGSPIPAEFTYLTKVEPGKAGSTIRAYLARYPDTGMVVIDTLGKVMPSAAHGETAYQRDYRVAGGIKDIADQHPGLAIVVLHHDRKATSEDFVDAVSGTNGLAGAADAIVVLARKRQSKEGILKVTGRDVVEAEYALTVTEGYTWTLDGRDLTEAAERAKQREESGGVSQTSTDVIGFVRQAGPDGITAGAVADKFGKDAYQYLRRQVDAGRLVKLARGRYAVPDTPVSEVSEVSETQVRGYTPDLTVSEARKGHRSRSDTPDTPYSNITVGLTRQSDTSDTSDTHMSEDDDLWAAILGETPPEHP